jgi:hypothetical protein
MQFITIFHLLKQSWIMTNFKGCKGPFNFRKMLNNLGKHWINIIGWSMVEAMHDFVLWFICLVGQKAQFIFVSCDEMTTVDNQSWILTHVYVVEGWKRLLSFLTM